VIILANFCLWPIPLPGVAQWHAAEAGDGAEPALLNGHDFRAWLCVKHSYPCACSPVLRPTNKAE